MALGQDTRESEFDTVQHPRSTVTTAPSRTAPTTAPTTKPHASPAARHRAQRLADWAQRNIVLAGLAAIVLVSALGGVGYFGYKALRGTPTVKLYTVSSQPLTSYIGGGGQVYANQTVNLIFPVNSRVLQVFVTIGQTVTKGQQLVQLDNADLQAQLVSAQEQWQRASNDGTPQTTVDQLLARYDALKQQLSSTVYNNGYLVASFNGVVTGLNAVPGMTTYQSIALVTVSDVSSLIVKAQFPLGQRAQVALKQTVEVDPVAQANLSFMGTVSAINQQLTTAGAGTFEVWITVPNPNQQLLVGQTVYARVTSKSQMLAVPELAVINANADSIVFVYSNGVVHLRHVTVAAQDGDLIGIQNGLLAGDQVVLVGGYQLTDGEKVNVSSTQS